MRNTVSQKYLSRGTEKWNYRLWERSSAAAAAAAAVVGWSCSV